MGSADFFMRHRALPWPVPSIRLRIWFVTVVLGAITLQIPGLRAQTTSTTEGIVADQQGLPVAGRQRFLQWLTLSERAARVSEE